MECQEWSSSSHLRELKALVRPHGYFRSESCTSAGREAYTWTHSYKSEHEPGQATGDIVVQVFSKTRAASNAAYQLSGSHQGLLDRLFEALIALYYRPIIRSVNGN